MAPPIRPGSSKPPSAWAIVLVASILILLPSLFCAGVLLTANSPESSTGQGIEIKKPQELKP